MASNATVRESLRAVKEFLTGHRLNIELTYSAETKTIAASPLEGNKSGTTYHLPDYSTLMDLAKAILAVYRDPLCGDCHIKLDDKDRFLCRRCAWIRSDPATRRGHWRQHV